MLAANHHSGPRIREAYQAFRGLLQPSRSNQTTPAPPAQSDVHQPLCYTQRSGMIEIQIVPSDIRRSVRYVFLDRRRVIVAVLLLSAVLVGIIGSMAAAPTVIRRVYKDNYAKSMRVERDIQRERLRENIVQMTSLERSLEDHRVRVEKLITVYGLEHNLGQGGFSLPIRAKGDLDDLQLNDAQHRETALRNAMQSLQQQLEELAQYEAANVAMVRQYPSYHQVPT